jgi:hypothetical protein
LTALAGALVSSSTRPSTVADLPSTGISHTGWPRAPVNVAVSAGGVVGDHRSDTS